MKIKRRSSLPPYNYSSNIPLTTVCSETSAQRFLKVLLTHVPPSKEVVILDPTCGKKNLWSAFSYETLDGSSILDSYGKIIFSDIEDFGSNLVSDLRDLKFSNEIDAIVYDPPFLFGITPKKRVDTEPTQDHFYGNYTQTYDDLKMYMKLANDLFPLWLKSTGKLILKCQDQFNILERKFYPHHVTWVNELTNFELIDLFVVPHFRPPMTAFLVKPPRGVINHTYFLVFGVKKHGKPL